MLQTDFRGSVASFHVFTSCYLLTAILMDIFVSIQLIRHTSEATYAPRRYFILITAR